MSPFNESKTPNIFAFGDVCKTCLNESKGVIAIAFLNEYIVKNIIQTMAGRKPSNQIPSKIPFVCMVSLGPTFGVLTLNGLVNAKDESKKIASGEPGALEAYHKKLNTIFKVFGCLNVCCCCCPCSICFTPTTKSNARRLLNAQSI